MAKCDDLMRVLGPLAVAGGSDKAVIHGEHEDDLSEANLLFAVKSDEKFSDIHPLLVYTAFQLGLYGAVDRMDFIDEDSSFDKMDSLYENPITHHYEQDGDTLVSTRQMSHN